MRFTGYSFGSVRVDGVTYDHDLIIDRGKVRKRKKAASRKFRGANGHTPLSIAERNTADVLPQRRIADSARLMPAPSVRVASRRSASSGVLSSAWRSHAGGNAGSVRSNRCASTGRRH